MSKRKKETVYHYFKSGNVFDIHGYDTEGFDKDGYNSKDEDRNRYKRDVEDIMYIDGYARNGDAKGFDKFGYDINGFNKEGYHRDIFNLKKEIKYLAFEGGGGKGIAFLGAIAALEKVGVLKSKTSDGTVIGIAGASAGAMAGFLLALGYDTMGITKALSNTKTFIGFYDGPKVGITRAVINNEFMEHVSGKFEKEEFYEFLNEDSDENYKTIICNMVDSFPTHSIITGAGVLGLTGGYTLGVLGDKHDSNAASFGGGMFTTLLIGSMAARLLVPCMAKSKIRKLGTEKDSATNEIKDTPFKELVEKIAHDIPTLRNYIKNMLLDRGLFPGFKLREFLSNAYRQRYEINDNPSFDNLLKIAKINFRTVSINSTTYKPQIFSNEKTPRFPVIDAVGMSASFPFAFKPVLVKGCQPKDKSSGPPDGYYADGGLLINLPMHLFDKVPDGKLHENMLGIRLEVLNPEEEDNEKEDPGVLDILMGYAGSMLDTALFPSEEGQIRTDKERWQTLDLDVTNIETLQFVSPVEKSGPKIIEAYIKTRFMLDKDFKVMHGSEIIFDPTLHYEGITIFQDKFIETKEGKGEYYEFDVAKFITLLPDQSEYRRGAYNENGYDETGYDKYGFDKDGKDKWGGDVKGIATEIIMETIMNENDEIFAKMLLKLKKQ